MLKLFEPILTDLAAEPISLSARRFGLVSACDGGLLEVSGLSVPVGFLLLSMAKMYFLFGFFSKTALTIRARSVTWMVGMRLSPSPT